MDDRRREGPPESRSDDRQGGRSRESGPPGTDFLDLEISQVLYGEAAGVARDAFRALLEEAVKARLKERFGAKIEALAKIAADELVDDVETNLAIEALIQTRKQAHRGREDAIRRALGQDKPEGTAR
jgi:hypothetical protein